MLVCMCVCVLVWLKWQLWFATASVTLRALVSRDFYLASSSTECCVLVTVFVYSLYDFDLLISFSVKVIKKYPTLLRLSFMICFVSND